MKNDLNIYMPSEAEIKEVITLTPDVNRYTVLPEKPLAWKPGQFFMLSVMGHGEVPISVTSSPEEPLMFTIRKVGYVTTAIHALKAGDVLGLRGPYGNGFPMDIAGGRDVIVMAGGLGIAPLRPVIRELAENRKDYGKAFLIFGSKRPCDIIYRSECPEWEKSGINIILTVDCGDEAWSGCTGVVPAHLGKAEVDYANSAVYICGPEVMIEAAMKAVAELGAPEDRIITTLEAHMKCGVGKCGHCYKGPEYICTDGPVFSYKDLRRLSERFVKSHSPHADPMWGY